MIPAVLAVLATVAARAIYPKYLERRQAARRPMDAEGIVVGAAPIDLPRSGAPGVLLLHGAGDTPQVLAALAEYLHGRGFSVRVPLLAGHGRALSAFAGASADEWRRDAERELEAMRATHEWVGLVGLSMGGALALRLAADRPNLPALVLLAPYVAMPPAIQRMAETSRFWGWLLPYFSSRGGRSVRDEQASERSLGHGLFTPAALRALYDVYTDALRALQRVKTPTLVIQSREDNRIPAESAERAFAQLAAAEKQFVWTNGAGHVITVDFGHQRVFELTSAWLRRHYGRPMALAETAEGSAPTRTDPRVRSG
jgi:carboxylesterase